MSGRIFTSFRVGGFTILPEGEPLPGDGTISLVLGKKGAFGSGEHETTAACLELLEQLPVAGARALDLGSGTGILAIAAVRLGAGQAVAIDIDGPAACSCAAICRTPRSSASASRPCGPLSTSTPSPSAASVTATPSPSGVATTKAGSPCRPRQRYEAPPETLRVSVLTARGCGSSGCPSLRMQAWSRSPQPRGGLRALGRPGGAHAPAGPRC